MQGCLAQWPECGRKTNFVTCSLGRRKAILGRDFRRTKTVLRVFKKPFETMSKEAGPGLPRFKHKPQKVAGRGQQVAGRVPASSAPTACALRDGGGRGDASSTHALASTGFPAWDTAFPAAGAPLAGPGAEPQRTREADAVPHRAAPTTPGRLSDHCAPRVSEGRERCRGGRARRAGRGRGSRAIGRGFRCCD